jgi:molybdopterin/thiamine biosynthesis adenylyltransferase/rhodanese-related sulfurtransferase
VQSVSDRYARQRVLPQLGEAGQARLAAARVLVVGAGGLGSAVLPYLAAAGIGRLAIIDPDRVEESNLHRQPLYRMSDLGEHKVHAAARALRALNPGVDIDGCALRLDAANAPRRVAGADVVVDCADSFAVTYVLSDACQLAARPLVSASVLGLSGYVGAFCGGGPSYRAVFPELPRAAGSCAASGVLGTAVAVLGSLQAHLVLGLLLRWQPPVLARLMSLDLLTLHVGSFSFAAAPEPDGAALAFIAPVQIASDDIVIDLRSETEAPASPFAGALRLAVEQLEQGERRFPAAARVVLCCRSGVRAWRAARALQRQGHGRLALIALGE